MADYSVDIALKVKGQKQLKDILKPLNEINKNVKELVKITKQSAKTIPQSIDKINKKFDKTDRKLKKIKKQAKQAKKELEKLNEAESGVSGRSGGFPQRSRRSRIIQSAAIGGGFPLLFGGGIGQAIPGLIGGAVGEAASPGGGFAGSIAATALVAELTKIGQASIETANKISTLSGKLELARERSLFTSKETEELARQLERQGKAQELNNLLNQEYQKIIGAEGVAKLNKLNEVSSEFNRLMGILKTKFDAFIAGPLTRLLKFLNNILGQQANRGQFDRLRASLTGQEKENFEARLRELQGTRAGKGTVKGPITDAIRKIMMTEFGVQPLSEPKGKSLKPEVQLGIDRMADLEKEIETATLKNTLSEKDFEIEMRIQEIKKGTLDLEDDEIRKKLEKLYKLDEEQQKLQKTKELYSQIGQTIENGIVNAIEGAIQGTKTLGEVANSVFTQISRTLLQFGVNSLLGSIPGIGSLFKAEGGPVKRGGSYIVGERGPELFTPGSSGMITPNNQLGGSTNVVVNVDASGSAVEGDEDRGRELGRLISVAVQSELLEQKRPGGLLA